LEEGGEAIEAYREAIATAPLGAGTKQVQKALAALQMAQEAHEAEKAKKKTGKKPVIRGDGIFAKGFLSGAGGPASPAAALLQELSTESGTPREEERGVDRVETPLYKLSIQGEQLQCRVQLPKIDTAKDVELASLDDGNGGFELVVPGLYHLEVPLPRGVDGATLGAEFDRAARVLLVSGVCLTKTG